MKRTQSAFEEIFRRGSRTFFNSSLFFPEKVRRDVVILYAFVRTADDFVDSIPQDKEGFHAFRARYELARRTGRDSGDPIVDSFIELSRRRKFDEAWAEAFLNSMEADLTTKRYETPDEVLVYIHGSAEVIGFFMASIMELPSTAMEAAAFLGRAMQYINFIRDIAEDNELGRTYLPLAGSGLEDLTEDTARSKPEVFARFIRSQIDLYREWQAHAEAAFGWIPWRSRVAVMTAGEMYKWAATKIYRNPFIVYEKKVKPSRQRIILSLLRNAAKAHRCRRPEAPNRELT